MNHWEVMLCHASEPSKSKQTHTHTHEMGCHKCTMSALLVYQKPLSIAQKRSVHVTTLFGCDVDPGYRLVANHSLQARLRHFTNSSTASKLCACPSTPHKCYTWTLGWAHSQNHCPQKPFQCHCQIARLYQRRLKKCKKMALRRDKLAATLTGLMSKQ